MTPTRTPSPLSRRARILLPIGLVALVGLSVERLILAQPEAPVHEFSGLTMGTTYSVKVAEPLDPADRATVDSVVAAELEMVNTIMSTYDSTSELSYFNAHASTEPFPASAALLEVVAVAMAVSSESGGAFDVTVGPLVNAWGFGPGEHRRIPSVDEIASLSKRVGYRQITINAENSALVKAHPFVEADLSGVAKGYGVDRVAASLEGLGIMNFLIEVGGELKARGVKPGRMAWQVAVEAPDDDVRRIHTRMTLVDAAVATSGDYRNFYIEDGIRYAHIIDPRTGRPTRHSGASVTVSHPEAAMADAWATALGVLGPDEGFELAVRRNIAAMFIARTDEGYETRSTPAFEHVMTTSTRTDN